MALVAGSFLVELMTPVTVELGRSHKEFVIPELSVEIKGHAFSVSLSPSRFTVPTELGESDWAPGSLTEVQIVVKREVQLTGRDGDKLNPIDEDLFEEVMFDAIRQFIQRARASTQWAVDARRPLKAYRSSYATPAGMTVQGRSTPSQR